MKCIGCSRKATFNNLCENHFVDFFEKKVHKTIEDYRLISKKTRIAVAASGGKDSTSCLYLMNKWYGAEAFIIDEGIAGYRDKTLGDLKKFCKENKIKLNIYSFKKEFGYTLDQMCKKLKENPCFICGVLRRHLLNIKTKRFDRIATGHNMDDECQSILMNLLRNNMDSMARLGPSSGIKSQKGFTQRIKPLYFCSEKEVLAYSFIKKFPIHFSECPYTQYAYRLQVRDFLNVYESDHKGTKKAILSQFLKMLPKLKAEYQNYELDYCSRCLEPSANKLCMACTLIEKL